MHDAGDTIDARMREDRSRWGRVRGGRASSLWIAIPAAALLATVVGGVTVLTGAAGERPLLGALVFAIAVAWPAFGLVWALVVDRGTLRGAIDRPEESVESRWYEIAAGKAFTDVLLVTGLGTAVVAFGGLEPPVLVVLSAVIVAAMGAFGVRYLLERTRG